MEWLLVGFVAGMLTRWLLDLHPIRRALGSRPWHMPETTLAPRRPLEPWTRKEGQWLPDGCCNMVHCWNIPLHRHTENGLVFYEQQPRAADPRP
jgi:hypothetical protein